jgi:ATP-dependent Clp protease ATP-binding subunit ClpA
MFERFTSEARDAVHVAQVDATAQHAPAVGCVHLLLGCAATNGLAQAALAACGVELPALRAAAADVLDDALPRPDAAALRTIGIELEAVRSHVEQAFGEGALERTRAAGGRGRARGLPFTPTSKRGLELALRAALERGDRHVGVLHVLLGLCRCEDPALEAALGRVGTTPAALEAAALSAADRRATGT